MDVKISLYIGLIEINLILFLNQYHICNPSNNYLKVGKTPIFFYQPLFSLPRGVTCGPILKKFIWIPRPVAFRKCILCWVFEQNWRNYWPTLRWWDEKEKEKKVCLQKCLSFMICMYLTGINFRRYINFRKFHEKLPFSRKYVSAKCRFSWILSKLLKKRNK